MRAGNRRDVVYYVDIVVNGLVGTARCRVFLLTTIGFGLITVLQGTFLSDCTLRILIELAKVCRGRTSMSTRIISCRRMSVVSLVGLGVVDSWAALLSVSEAVRVWT